MSSAYRVVNFSVRLCIWILSDIYDSNMKILNIHIGPVIDISKHLHLYLTTVRLNVHTNVYICMQSKAHLMHFENLFHLKRKVKLMAMKSMSRFIGYFIKYFCSHTPTYRYNSAHNLKLVYQWYTGSIYFYLTFISNFFVLKKICKLFKCVHSLN